MNDRMIDKVRRALGLERNAAIPTDVAADLEDFWKFYTSITGANGNTPTDDVVALALWVRSKLPAAERHACRKVEAEIIKVGEELEPMAEAVEVPDGQRPWSGRGRKPNWLREKEAAGV